MLYVIIAYISYPVFYVIGRFLRKGAMSSVLVFQTAKIGDMICTTPVFREIKKAYPHIMLGVVADPVSAVVIRNNPHIDEIIVVDKDRLKGFFGKVSFARDIYRRRYSAALILAPNLPNILAAFWGGIPKRVVICPDYMGGTLKEALTLNTDFEYHVSPRMVMDTYLAALRYLGINTKNNKKEVYAWTEAEIKFSETLMGPAIGLALSAGNPFKQWGKDKFVALARMLFDATGYTIVLLGYERERSVGVELAATVKSEQRVLNMCGTLSLEELPSIIKRLHLLVGVDTGLIYMADAMGVPVVDIAGPCDMNDQRPTGPFSRVLGRKDMACVPCSHAFRAPYECSLGHRKCIAGIAPDEVFRAAMSMLKGAGKV